jgi:hypothetical protein
VYSSVEATEQAIDAARIERNEYAFYDAEGMILVPELVHLPGGTDVGRSAHVGRWRLRESLDQYRDPDSLRGVLIEFLTGQGERKVGEPPRRLLHLDLPGLVRLAARFARR